MISVIVCTYNQEDTIGRTLDSILCQECHLPYEIVIGEDCSTDGTLAVCNAYQQAHPDKITWLYIYKGIKILLTVAMIVLYIFLVKMGSKAFIIIAASAYLIGLVVETFVYIHYTKHQNKENKA